MVNARAKASVEALTEDAVGSRWATSRKSAKTPHPHLQEWPAKHEEGKREDCGTGTNGVRIDEPNKKNQRFD